MCGIAGVLNLDGSPAEARIAEQMIETIVHRGPDQGRVLVDGNCALGNRRLAIQDLSPAGALPMRSADGKRLIAYNGEIYNYPSLRRDLEAQGETFISNSDTESLLILYRREGEAMLRHLRGMFAFALWDQEAQTLFVARDRMGEKPLYYYYDSRVFVFASEIKALLAHPEVPRRSAFETEPELLELYLSYGYIPTPRTAFQHIHALPPGHTITVDHNGVNIKSYWTPPYPQDSPAIGEQQAIQELRGLLEDSVKIALISDVPLGVFLSGGLDSSLIAALMCHHASEVKSFSIGFAGDDSFDETPYAQQVATHLGTKHTVFTVEPEALGLLHKLVWHHDQPFADSSAIPTYLVSKLTRQHVTVALTGDGGDELFAGYERFYAAALAGQFAIMPRPLWSAAAALANILPEGTGYYNPIKRARRFLHGASQPLAQAYFDWVRLFDAITIRDLLDHPRISEHDLGAAKFVAALRGSGVEGLLDANMRTYLPDDLLIKGDRASMAASLEGRAPFLDVNLVEWASKLPLSLKLRGKTTKYILKQVAQGLLPESIIHRQKHGFGVPLGTWLRKDAALVRALLLSSEAKQRGLLKSSAVEGLITDHISGARDHGQRLWTLLTLEAWHQVFIDQTVTA